MNKFNIFKSMLISTAIFSGGSDNRVQLLKTATYDYGGYAKYEYDDQNRMTKMYWYNEKGHIASIRRLSYNENDLIKITYEEVGFPEDNVIEVFTRNGNTITIKHTPARGKATVTTLYLDNDGFPKELRDVTEDNSHIIKYKVVDGNLMEERYEEIKYGERVEVVITYMYDKKKSPFYYCNTPRWFKIWSGQDPGKNNITLQSWSNLTEGCNLATEYTYEYDSAGFPTKRTATRRYVDCTTGTYETLYEYIIKK